jgi:glycogen synthase
MLARVVFPLHGYGGIERHVFHLVTHLAHQGVDVTLFVQDAPDGIASADRLLDTSSVGAQIDPARLRLRTLRYDYTAPYLRPNSIVGRQLNYPLYSWRLGLLAAQGVRRGAFDVVHAQGLCASGYGALHARDALLASVPFVANPHGMEEYRTPDWRKWLAYAPFRALYSYGTRCADVAIATDACTQDDLPRYLGVAARDVTVIPSAIDVDECLAAVSDATRAALRARFKLGERLTLLSVSRLERNKGYHILAEALARLRHELPANWQWLLVGKGKEERALKQLVEQLGIAANTVFVGSLSDAELHSLYEEIDLFVHPTLYEGSSLVTLEAMIHRRPVVAAASGGIPDKVFDGVNGYLVRPGDANDLCDKLRLTLAQRAAWQSWGLAGARIVEQTFAWPVVAASTKALYERLLPAKEAQG